MIERAKPGHAGEIFELHDKATRLICSSSYPPEIIKIWNEGRKAERLKTVIENEQVYIYIQDRIMKGYVHFNMNTIAGLYVNADTINKGIGRKLFEFAVKHIHDRPVKLQSTLNAIGFYKKMGCLPLGYSIIRRNDRDIYVLDMEYV